MKIQNISSVKAPMPVSFMTAAGKTISVHLGQGEFVYTDTNVETKSIIIQVKKGNIKTETIDKPGNLNYFDVYGPASDTSPKEEVRKSLAKSLEEFMDNDSSLDVYRKRFNIPAKVPIKNVVINPELDALSDKVLFPEKLEQANEILKKTEQPTEQPTEQAVKQPAKNKGGRPKGSKDKVKQRGVPKLKKPAGRPINTDMLQGLSVEEVTTKCEARGYSVRKTQEDGTNYIITCDLRLDRVNIVIENGIIIRANIG